MYETEKVIQKSFLSFGISRISVLAIFPLIWFLSQAILFRELNRNSYK